jgi:ATP phosphoribosyltransferase regulatory subunit
MIHQPPAGARDLLPLEVTQKCWINDCLQDIFQRWGYQRIVTSTLERLDTLMAGDAIDPQTVIQVQNSEEGALGLRPELTASIARASVTRMATDSYPQRLCYRSNIFRRPSGSHAGRQVEFFQAGVELLGSGGVLADAEVVLLLVECVQKLGVKNWSLLMGEAGLTRSLLAAFPEALRPKIRACLANLDRVGLEQLELSDGLRDRALFLFDLRGKPEDVIAKAATLDLDPAGQEIINNLKALFELLGQTSPTPLPIVLDLSLMQTIDYYTGIVFDVIGSTETEKRLLGQGGRYDQLLGLYHPQGKSTPGIGFALSIEELHGYLLDEPQLPQEPPPSDWLVIPTTPSAHSQAFVYAQKLRAVNHKIRVEVELGARSRPDLLTYAQDRRITHLAWINPQGIPTIEVL